MTHASGRTTQQRSALASRMLAHLRDGTTDQTDAVEEVDPRTFWDPSVAAMERERVFGAVPLLVAHRSEVARPLDFLVTTLPRSRDVVVVRQEDGSLKTFLNVCRHRGGPVVQERRGQRRVFTCPYHGWAYRPDGSLKAISDEDTFGDVDHCRLGLVELPTAERNGFVWVLDRVGAELDVEAWLGPMDGVLGPYRLEDHVCFRSEAVEVRANWKILVDAFVDGYHLKFVHRKSAAPYFHNNTYVYDQRGPHATFTSARRSIDTMEDPGSVEEHVTTGHLLMPNHTLLRQPTHFELLSFFPAAEDPARTRMEFRLIVPATDDTPELAGRWDRNWDILMRVVRDEDLPLNEALQRAAEVPSAPPLLFGRNELANQAFHQNLSRCMGEPSPADGPGTGRGATTTREHA